MNDLDRQKELTEKLNKYRDAYYNNNEMLISDKEYDDLFDELCALEEKTGVVLNESPTSTVGYGVQSELKKVKHDHPMLSLDKTKSVEDLVKFCGDKQCFLSLKMDGLTCTLHYDENGDLVKAETRGNGEIGEDVLKNAMCISNIPKHIDNHGIPYTIDGEVIITYDAFGKVNESLEDKYKHPRNLASGSLRQLDPKITKERNLTFVAWKVVEGDESNSFAKRIMNANDMGFTVSSWRVVNPNLRVDKVKDLETHIDALRDVEAKELSYPIDGMVITYDDITYGESLGMTGHHPRHSLAFKFYDECYETVLRDIEWRTTRTGMIAPVAVFDPVDLDGAITTRATLHNLSIMKELKLGIGDTITVYRANAVIPKIKENLTKSNTYEIPRVCPCCGCLTEVRKDGTAEFLYCTNDKWCPSMMLSKYVHFCSKEGMDIDGLSEATLEMLISRGYVKKYADIYHLDVWKDELIKIPGFGEKSYENLWKAICASKNTTLEKYLVALGINGVGKSTAKVISNYFYHDLGVLITELGNGFNLTEFKDFGIATSDSIYDWYHNKYDQGIEKGLTDELVFDTTIMEVEENEFLDGKTFVVTGAFNTMKRADIETLITTHGGKLSGSVSKKTDYLLTNETTGTTKYNKAMELGVPVMNEEEFLSRVNNG